MAGVGGVDRERRPVGGRLVAARAERVVAGAGQHDGADGSVGLGVVEAGGDFAGHRFVERVAPSPARSIVMVQNGALARNVVRDQPRSRLPDLETPSVRPTGADK